MKQFSCQQREPWLHAALTIVSIAMELGIGPENVLVQPSAVVDTPGAILVVSIVFSVVVEEMLEAVGVAFFVEVAEATTFLMIPAIVVEELGI